MAITHHVIHTQMLMSVKLAAANVIRIVRTLKAHIHVLAVLATPWPQMDSPAPVSHVAMNSLTQVASHIGSFIDIDECQMGTDRCSHDCQDTSGSYTCSCPDGYTLNSNGYTCNGKR